MKLILAIINNDDSVRASSELNRKGFFVTRLSTTGGFLMVGNTTLLIGTEDGDVDKVKEIPCDYFGKMGVPITYLEKHDGEIFDIIGLYDNHAKGKDDGILISGDLVRVAIKTGGSRNWTGAVIDGKTLYARVIIQRRTSV